VGRDLLAGRPRPYYLEVLAGVTGQQDDPQRAVRLFAAARSILDASGSGRLHAFVPRVPPDDAVLAALRSQTSDAAFEEAQAWGRSAGRGGRWGRDQLGLG